MHQGMPARLRVGVVGAGRVGSVLAARLRAAGHDLVAVSGASPASRLRIDTLLPGVRVATPAEVADAADVLVLAVPDDALVAVAEQLTARPGQVVLHTSGRHGLEALASLARQGARPVAFHPAMTFTGTELDLDRSCVFGLTAGPDERALAERLVADLGGTPVWIAEDDRAAYHAALAHGSNHLVTVVNQAMDLLRSVAGPDADAAAVLRPLLEASLDNVLSFGDAALTGPVARGDISTVRAHLDALAGGDDVTAGTYRELARATAHRAERDGRIDAATSVGVRQALDEAEWDSLAASVEQAR